MACVLVAVSHLATAPPGEVARAGMRTEPGWGRRWLAFAALCCLLASPASAGEDDGGEEEEEEECDPDGEEECGPAFTITICTYADDACGGSVEDGTATCLERTDEHSGMCGCEDVEDDPETERVDEFYPCVVCPPLTLPKREPGGREGVCTGWQQRAKGGSGAVRLWAVRC